MVGAGTYVNLSDYKISKNLPEWGMYSGQKYRTSGHQGIVEPIDQLRATGSPKFANL